MAKYSKRWVLNGDYNKIMKFRRLKDEKLKRAYAAINGSMRCTILKVEDSPQRKMWNAYRVELKKGAHGNYFISPTLEGYIIYNKTEKKYIEKQGVSIMHAYFNKFQKERLDWFMLSKDYRTIQFFFKLKSVRKAIFLDKITNTDQLIKTYLSSQGLSKLPRKPFLDGSIDITHLHTVCSCIRKSSNKERDLPYFYGDYNFNHILPDLINLSGILGEKINYTWSEKRMVEEHNRMSKEVKKLKMMLLDKKEINYLHPFPENKYFTLLTNVHEFLEEGDDIKHCVFSSNYFERAFNKSIIILSYKDGDERGTAEIMFNKTSHKEKEYFEITPYIAQFRGKYNAPISDKANDILKSFIKEDERFVEWVQKEFATKKEQQYQAAAEWLPF